MISLHATTTALTVIFSAVEARRHHQVSESSCSNNNPTLAFMLFRGRPYHPALNEHMIADSTAPALPTGFDRSLLRRYVIDRVRMSASKERLIDHTAIQLSKPKIQLLSLILLIPFRRTVNYSRSQRRGMLRHEPGWGAVRFQYDSSDRSSFPSSPCLLSVSVFSLATNCRMSG